MIPEIQFNLCAGETHAGHIRFNLDNRRLMLHKMPQHNTEFSTKSSSTTPMHTLSRFLAENSDVVFIRFQWLDYSGVLRARVLVTETVEALLAGGKRLPGTPIALNCTVDSHTIPGTIHDSMYTPIPDWSTLSLASSPGNASVMCDLEYAVPGSPVNWDMCPRQTLRKTLRHARQKWSLDFLVGFEIELMVMKRDPVTGYPVPCSRGLGNFAVSGLRDHCYQYVEECVRRLRDQGVRFYAVHTEGYQGQYEIALGPLSPLEAVDQLVLVQSFFKDYFARHGYIVTMFPKPVESDSQANGQHTHLSLQPASVDYESFFLAGMLKHLPSLCAFCLPQSLSYERLQPLMAGETVSWGTNSRLVPIRKIKPSHWEVRCIDATANMYLTLAAILGAGLLGLEGQEPLVWPDLIRPENKNEPGDFLPQSLEESLTLLDTDFGGLSSMIGRPLIDHYVRMKRHEVSQLNKLTPEIVRELLVQIF